jgi:Ca-activated chloride channel homolog
MKNVLNFIVIALLIAVAVAIAIPAYRYVRANPISKANDLKVAAEEAYLARNYVSAHEHYKTLIDSLHISDEPVRLNYANATYLSSNVMLEFYNQNKGPEKNIVGDSTLKHLVSISQSEYLALSGSGQNLISSKASNQLGYGLLRGTQVFEQSNPDSILVEALDHFKRALRADPGNDSIRHNYELIKKIVAYPETVLAESKALIAEKKYKQAASLLQAGMRRDPRLRKQRDFFDRLRIVIQIDSLNSRRL